MITWLAIIPMIASSLAQGGAGEPRPDFSAALLDRLRESPSAYVAVTLWSPQCSVCGEEVKELNRALEVLNAKDPEQLVALGIPLYRRKGEIEAFLSHFKPNYPQIEADSALATRALPDHVLPRTLLFRRGGHLIRDWVGKVSASEVIKTVQRKDPS